MTRMQELLRNKRVVGSTLVGAGLVFGAFVLSNFGEPVTISPGPLYVEASPAPARQYIEVVDADGDGIEDWKQEFVPREPVFIATSTSTPYEPTTVTEAVSVQFFESILRAKTTSFGPREDEVVTQTAERLRSVAGDTLYNTRDVIVIPTNPAAIREYANAMADVLIRNDIPDSESELDIINRALAMESPEELKKLEPITNAYKNMRDQSLLVPVPEQFLKQHLDLINVYQAIYTNLNDMRLIFDDPIVSLVRIQRYQDDATGLGNALRNMYDVLVPYASLFTADDPAVVFVLFAPNYQ